MSKNLREVLGTRAKQRVVESLEKLQKNKVYKFDLALFCGLLELAKEKTNHQIAIDSQEINRDEVLSPRGKYKPEDYARMNRYLDYISSELMVNPITFSSFLGKENSDNVALFVECIALLMQQASTEAKAAFSG